MERTIKPEDFAAIADTAMVLDVRRLEDRATSNETVPFAIWKDPTQIDQWIDAIPRIDIADRHPLAASEELAVRTRCRARSPGRGDRQPGMRVDQDRERAVVAVFPDIGVLRPDQLVAGHALAGRGHAREPEIGAIGEDSREQRIGVVAPPSGSQVGEAGEEAGFAGDIVEQLGDPDPRHQSVDAVAQGLGLDVGIGPDRRDLQPAIDQSDAFEPTVRQVVCEVLQPSIETGGSLGQPGVGG